jgi:hypothetical protein
MSAVTEFLDVVWDNANNDIGHSWERLNHAMHSALKLTIGAGFEFLPGDFDHIFSHYSSGRWIGESEWCYALAIFVGNVSACGSFEVSRKRLAFIADDVTPGERWSNGGWLHMVGDRKRGRLAVGFRFPWRGEKVTVTSFAADGQSLTACSYHREQIPIDPPATKGRRVVGAPMEPMPKNFKDGCYTSKVKKRYVITREAIIANRKDRKRRDELLDVVMKLDGTSREAIIVALNSSTQKDWDILPVAKIEAEIKKRGFSTKAHKKEKVSDA